jgi:cell division protein FtsL
METGDMAGEIESAIKGEVDKHIAALNAAHQERMISFEAEMREKVDRRARDLTNRLLFAAAAVVFAVVGAAALSMYGSLKEVNGQVIALQSGIISAQSTIRESNKELTEQTSKLAAANAALTTATRALDEKSADLEIARTKLTAAKPAR